MRLNHGFSVIEMIAVVMLLGIVGTVVFSRFSDPTSFNQAAVKDSLVTSIRQAQQAALGRSDVTFSIVQTADEYQFLVKSGANVLTTQTINSQNIVLQTGTAEALSTATDSCASGARFDASVQGFVIEFDSQGNIASFDYDANPMGPELNEDPPSFDFNGVRICVNDLVTASVCVSPAGYAYEGDCDP